MPYGQLRLKQFAGNPAATVHLLIRLLCSFTKLLGNDQTMTTSVEPLADKKTRGSHAHIAYTGILQLLNSGSQ